MADAVAPQDLTNVFELGRGAFGAVHRVRERATGRDVARGTQGAGVDVRRTQRAP